MYPHQRLVFLDPGVPHHPPSLPGFLSRVAEDHRRAGTPVIWLRSDRAWGIPRGDVTLDVPDPTADPHALSGTWDPLSTTALARTLAVVEIMAQRRVPAAHCFAYGDLCLDESVLAVVGNPRVVACCPKQAEYARSRGFAVIGTLPR